jgi:molybdopterin-guanine dinucleotide biosynthesis protein A
VENLILNVMSKANDLNGLVLAGGKSRRMGQDKSSLQYFGKSQRQVVYDLLSVFCIEVWVSASENQVSLWEDNLPYLVDEYFFKSPLNGILTALHFQKNQAWLVLACDLPFLNEEILRMLIEHRNRDKIATAFYRDDNFIEPLCTIWEKSSLRVIEEFVKEGNHSPKKILENSDCQLIKLENAFALQNVNNPDEYQQALKYIKLKSF